MASPKVLGVERKLNYKFGPKDDRDYPFKHIMKLDRTPLLPEVDLCDPHQINSMGIMPAVYDQGEEGSCTANAAVAHKEFIDAKYVTHVPMSRQFFYAAERIRDGDLAEDGGSTLRQSAETMKDVGVCEEAMYPYKFSTMLKMPPTECFEAAKKHQIGAYYAIQSQYEMQKCLTNGFMFVLGILVPTEMMSSEFTGVLSDVSKLRVVMEDGSPAGHALACVGYKKINGKLYFKIRNSWGTDWGQKGYFWVPAEFMTNDQWASDMFTYRLAKQPAL